MRALRDLVRSDRRTLVQTISSVGMLLVALLASLLLRGVLGVEFYYFLYLLAILTCAFIGGLLPGLLATAVSALSITVFLLEPFYSLGVGSADERLRLAEFLFEGAVVSVFGGWIRDGKRCYAERSSSQYGIAILLVSSVVVTKLLFLRSVGADVPFALFYAAITASTWTGGAGPGLLAIVLAVAAALLFFIEPLGELRVDDPVKAARIMLFVAESLVLTALTATYRRSRLASVVAQRESDRRAKVFQQRVRSMFEANPVGLALVDRDLSIFRCNDAFASLCRADRSELENASLSTFIAPDTALRLRTEVAAVLDAPRVTIRFDSKWSADGSVSVSACLVCLAEPEGSPVHAGLLCEDISERLRTQAELRESQSRLRQAEKMEAVGRLAGGIAHDFNNLLTVIIGYADMVAEWFPEGDRKRGDVQEIGKAAERAATLTHQLLTFSRKRMQQPENLSLNEIVSSTSRLLKRVIGEHILLELSLEPNLGFVFVDRSQMEMILLNLAANARDAMPHGGKLTIVTANAPPAPVGDDGVNLMVSDTGVGIEKAKMQHIFEPFFTTKEVGKGTGLGLSTVYGIVKQSSGDIRVDSEPGIGTKFTIRLPRTRRPARVELKRKPDSPATGSGTILIVEDEESLRLLLERILRGQGYLVISARTANDALALVERQNGAPNLLLTDVVMPGMSGSALAEQLRQRWPGLRVLFMSGYAAEAQEAIAGYVENGDFLQKPFTVETVIRRVNETLNRV
jgi:two-component system, cell cycle sensor histidine kinase and response regulator CckA